MSNDRAVLESRKEGKSFLDLVAKRISQPDLAAELISAAARLVVATASANGKENTPVAVTAAVVAPSDASMVVKFPGMSLNNPRGKFDLGFSPEALVLSNAKSSVVVPVAAITHVAILDQIPQDTKKRCLLFVVLDRNGPAVMNGKQRLEAVIIQTLETEVLKATTAAGDVLDGPAAAVLCEALALVKPGFQEFIAPDPDLFRTAKGHLGVSAYVKASAGYLFPLRGGLLFAERPPMFLPLADVLAVEYRRPQSATFDLVLHVRPRDGASSGSASVQQLEFSQVDKGELGRLQSYFATCKIKPYDPAAPPRLDGGGGSAAGGSGEAAGGAGAAGAAGGYADEDDDDDESDADDEDFDPSELQRLESGRAAKRQRTGASGSGAGPSTSKAAAEGAADEDDDEDEEEAEADGDSDEDESDEEEEDSYDEDEELADLTDEEDMAAEVVRRAAKRGGGQAAGGTEEEDEDDDDEDDD